MSTSLDPDQAQHFVGPDLGNILQNYQQTTLGSKEVKSMRQAIPHKIKFQVFQLNSLFLDRYIPMISFCTFTNTRENDIKPKN